MVIEEALEVVEGPVVVGVVMRSPGTELKAVRGRRDTPGLQEHNEQKMRTK